MGCINVDVWPVVLYNIHTSISVVNTTRVQATITGGTLETSIEEYKLPLTISTIPVGQRVSAFTQSFNDKINISLSIVCTTSLGDEVFLEVIEGRLITIDGQYIKVLKDAI